MKVKLDRDESFMYFVENSPLLATRWMVDMTKKELADFKRCERKYFDWQNKLDSLIQS